MSNYLVLARKYRPATLTELVGQEHVARALSNAIAMNRVPHALLFCGARGTGKTSTARIVAKMLNCETGPTATPCGTCSPCREIAAGTSLDVLELDAASNRGIDEIRELRSGVGYSPARDRSKIYIVDEAHMLTDAAANAFLKTLEEPPSHVVFILATTDPQRLPITIRSRCQRYDFRRVKAGDVVQRLASICASEGVEVEMPALYLVAREGDGSMRDSLSVLDQVIAFGGAHLDEADVASLLGVADRARTHQLLAALLHRDASSALHAVAAANDHGMDLRTFARTMAMEARDLLVTRLAGTAARDLVDRADSEIEALATLGAATTTPEMERLAHVLLEMAEQVANARHARLVLELGVIRLCRAAGLVDVAELAVRVEGLLSGARLPRPGGGTGGGGGGTGGTPGGGTAGPGAPLRSVPSLQAGPVPVASQAAPHPLAAPIQPQTARIPPQSAQTPAMSGPVAPTIAVPVAIPPREPQPELPPVPVARVLRDDDLVEWMAALQRRGRAAAASLLDIAVVQDAGPGRVRLGLTTDFLSRQAADLDTVRVLEEGAAQAFGGTWRVEIGPHDPRAKTDSPGARRQRSEEAMRHSTEASLRSDRRVLAVCETLGGQIVQVFTDSPEVPAAGGVAPAQGEFDVARLAPIAQA